MRKDEFFVQVAQAMSGCQAVEQALKLYLAEAFEAVRLPSVQGSMPLVHAVGQFTQLICDRVEAHDAQGNVIDAVGMATPLSFFVQQARQVRAQATGFGATARSNAYEIPGTRACSHDVAALREIGVEVSEQFDIAPQRVRVIRHP
jgi:hypothetical protein